MGCCLGEFDAISVQVSIEVARIWCGLVWMGILTVRSGATVVAPAAAWDAIAPRPRGLVTGASLCASVLTSSNLASAAPAELRSRDCRSHRCCVAAFTFSRCARLHWCMYLNVQTLERLPVCARFCRPASACLRLSGPTGACGHGAGGRAPRKLLVIEARLPATDSVGLAGQVRGAPGSRAD